MERGGTAMNIPELMRMIYQNFDGMRIRYVVDMLEVHQDIPNLRTANHEVKQFIGCDEVLPFLLDCDLTFWELVDWTVEQEYDVSG
jgi:hypothetical protein